MESDEVVADITKISWSLAQAKMSRMRPLKRGEHPLYCRLSGHGEGSEIDCTEEVVIDRTDDAYHLAKLASKLKIPYVYTNHSFWTIPGFVDTFNLWLKNPGFGGLGVVGFMRKMMKVNCDRFC